MQRIEPGPAGWEAWTLLLCYADPLVILIFSGLLSHYHWYIFDWSASSNTSFQRSFTTTTSRGFSTPVSGRRSRWTQ